MTRLMQLSRNPILDVGTKRRRVPVVRARAQPFSSEDSTCYKQKKGAENDTLLEEYCNGRLLRVCAVYADGHAWAH